MMEFDNCKSPLIGVEYVVSFESNSFDYLVCILCNKKGNAGNILNHLKCQKHRLHFLVIFFLLIKMCVC